MCPTYPLPVPRGEVSPARFSTAPRVLNHSPKDLCLVVPSGCVQEHAVFHKGRRLRIQPVDCSVSVNLTFSC